MIIQVIMQPKPMKCQSTPLTLVYIQTLTIELQVKLNQSSRNTENTESR